MFASQISSRAFLFSAPAIPFRPGENAFLPFEPAVPHRTGTIAVACHQTGHVMKAIILASAICLVYLALVTVAFRLAASDAKRARLMTLLFLCTLPIVVLLHFLTPPDLGFIPPALVENPGLDLGLLVFLYSSSFFGGVLQLYNLADRGFSLRIAIDISQSHVGGMTVAGVIRSYSEGKGTNWMYQKRIDDLVELRLVKIEDDRVTATPEGLQVAARFSWLRNFIRVEATGGHRE